jgi:hypothetical protein
MPGFFDNPALFADPNAPTTLPFPGTSFGFLPPQLSLPAWPPLPQPVPSAAPIPPAMPRAHAPIYPAAPAPATSPAPTPAAVLPSNASVGPSPGNPLSNHAATLMALGAGIAQGGIGRGLAMASSAAEAERNRQARQSSYLQTYKALVDGGVPQDEALAATLNPGLMRTLATKYLGTRSSANRGGNFFASPSTPAALSSSPASSSSAPSTPGMRQASDGKWYVADPNRLGKYLMVQ